MPFAFVTTTSTAAPGGPGGAVQVIVVSLTTAMPVAAAPPSSTAGAPAPRFRKPVPLRVRAVPPRALPAAGAIAVTAGSGWKP